ncbi:MAG: ribonuclease III [Porphyromonadaceae bacterium]|nr:ribonuclease III [Porphyromonadaceae bacterium]
MLRHREPYLSFYKLLGFLPHNIGLYQQAVTHRSASFTDKEGRKVNNERLEFLGDAVFTLVSADILYHAFPEKKEGFLSNSRSRIIQRETLNQIAVEMGLDKLVQSDVQIVSHNNYIYGNAFEALIGAIYLDVGFKRCRRFIAERIFSPYIDLEKITQTEINFKSKLVEWGQRQHVHIGWKLESASVDENNNPLFTVCAIAGQVEGEAATGYSKKEAQQKASQLILRKLYQDKDFLRAILYTERNASITEADGADAGRESVTQD